MPWKFKIYADKADEFRWRLIASNGEPVASSGEAFASKANAKRAAETVKENAGSASIEED